MRLNISIQPEETEGEVTPALEFNVELRERDFNIAKESVKLVGAVTKAIKSIQNELGKEG